MVLRDFPHFLRAASCCLYDTPQATEKLFTVALGGFGCCCVLQECFDRREGTGLEEVSKLEVAAVKHS